MDLLLLGNFLNEPSLFVPDLIKEKLQFVAKKILPGNSSVKTLFFRLNSCVAMANLRFTASEVSIEPKVGLFSSINDKSPVKIVPTDHAGFQVSGW